MAKGGALRVLLSPKCHILDGLSREERLLRVQTQKHWNGCANHFGEPTETILETRTNSRIESINTERLGL